MQSEKFTAGGYGTPTVCAQVGAICVSQRFFFRSRTANYDDDNENDCGTGDHNDTDATNDDRGENHSDRQLGG
jgi:hypothetical protein